jgi:hypothetical protein
VDVAESFGTRSVACAINFPLSDFLLTSAETTDCNMERFDPSCVGLTKEALAKIGQLRKSFPEKAANLERVLRNAGRRCMHYGLENYFSLYDCGKPQC